MDGIVELGRETMMLTLMLASPLLLVGLIVGALSGVVLAYRYVQR